MEIKHLHAATNREFGRYDLADVDKAFEFLGERELSSPTLSVVYEDGTVMTLQVSEITKMDPA